MAFAHIHTHKKNFNQKMSKWYKWFTINTCINTTTTYEWFSAWFIFNSNSNSFVSCSPFFFYFFFFLFNVFLFKMFFLVSRNIFNQLCICLILNLFRNSQEKKNPIFTFFIFCFAFCFAFCYLIFHYFIPYFHQNRVCCCCFLLIILKRNAYMFGFNTLTFG